MSSIYRKDIIVSGKVDDVDFWKAAREKAESLDLSGKFNLTSRKRGAVAGVLMGSGDHIRRFASWVKEQSGKRKNIEVEEVQIKDHGTFDESQQGPIKVELVW